MNRTSRASWYRSAISAIWSESASVRRTCPGSAFISATRSAISSGNSVPRACARYSATRCSAAIWVANVFVAATPISGPACVYRMPSASRAIDEPTVFVIAMTCDCWCRACRTAWSVSIVSPDCDTPSVSVFASSTGSR